MNKIRASLIHEARGFDASFELLLDTLECGGFEVTLLGGKPDPNSAPWEGNLCGTTLFLSSLLFNKYALTPCEESLWAERIKNAICNGAGLVAMLDESSLRVLIELKRQLEACPEPHIKLPVALEQQNKQVKSLIFRPLMTKDGKEHKATKRLKDKSLPMTTIT